MKKKVFGRQLSRSRPAREALFASLIRAMILGGKMVTTRAKAKAMQGELEKIVTLAKKGDLAGRRRVLARLDNADDAVKALYQNVVPAFSDKNSGYSRLIPLPTRKGDRAEMVRMEWTEKIIKGEEVENKKKGKKEKTEKEAKAKKVVKKVVKP
jgi:large subunit ribosomal protein L17